MFKEQTIQEGDILKITISIQERTHAIDKKLIYMGDHRELIPKNLLEKVKLISSPEKKISNMNKEKYIRSGTWIYQIEKTKPATRNRRTSKQKDSTTSSKSDTIKKPTKKEE
tara:strand:+ start:599 stop:934 length:336 start_codon:yes stop_codon:yes gene_type:complete